MHEYDIFCSILQPSLKDLQHLYMDTDTFVLSFTEGDVPDEHMHLSNLRKPIKTNSKFPGKTKHELGSTIIEEFIALSPQTYRFKDYPNKTKWKKE